MVVDGLNSPLQTEIKQAPHDRVSQHHTLGLESQITWDEDREGINTGKTSVSNKRQVTV